jgi:hypothetical protein
MQRVESEPAMTATSAEHRVSVSAFTSAILSSSPVSSSVLPIPVVSILRLSTLALLGSLVLTLLVLSSPADVRR